MTIVQLLRHLGQYAKKKMVVSNEYVENFKRAENTFLYQLVFDPIARQLRPLHTYPDTFDSSELEYAGRYSLRYTFSILPLKFIRFL